MIIGVISDTHGLMRPQALEALGGSDLILHAGDIGSQAILHELMTLAPVVAVRGNNDKGAWAKDLPERDVIEVEGLFFYLIHDVKELDLDPVAAGFRVVVSGHSHHPGSEERKGVLYLNPGSAGPRRFTLPITVARLALLDGVLSTDIIELAV
jgi:uncharacterized protein